MDLLAIILACSLHPDDALVRALVDAQSGGTVLFVGDLARLTMNDGLRTTADALRYGGQIRRRGGRPAVGLLGIPLDWAARYGLRDVDLFDACTNISVGTAALSEYHDRCIGAFWHPSKKTPIRSRGHSPKDRARPSARACVLARFAADLGVTGMPTTILKALAGKQRESLTDARGPAPERSAIFGPEPSGALAVEEWVDASERTMADRAAHPEASGSNASVRRTPTRQIADDQLRVLPGPLPSASAAAASRVSPQSRRR